LRGVGGRLDPGEPGRTTTICPEQLRGLDECGRGIGRRRADACNQTASFQQVQISVRRRVTERRVAGQVGLVEEFAGSLRGQKRRPSGSGP